MYRLLRDYLLRSSFFVHKYMGGIMIFWAWMGLGGGRQSFPVNLSTHSFRPLTRGKEEDDFLVCGCPMEESRPR